MSSTATLGCAVFAGVNKGAQPRVAVLQKTVAALLSAFALMALCAIAHAEKHPPSKPIDLNLANVKELQELPGVGPVTAQRIVDMREKSGRFKRVEDLLAIRGISQKKLDALRPYVTVSAPPLPSTLPSQKSSPPTKKQSPPSSQ